MEDDKSIEWLRSRFLGFVVGRSMKDYNADVANGWFSILQGLYSEKHRAYHNFSHVSRLLRLWTEDADFRKIRSTTGLIAGSDLGSIVELGIWFHDAFYDPSSSSNESKSADLAIAFSNSINFRFNSSEELIRRVIMSTTHRRDSNETPKDRLSDFMLGRVLRGSGDRTLHGICSSTWIWQG